MDLKDKRVLVTGGAARIGRVICEMLASRGCVVCVHYNRSDAEAMDLIMKLKTAGCIAFAVQADLLQESHCVELIDSAWNEAGGLDILINNAAMFVKDSVASTVAKDVDEQMKINYLAPVMLSKLFAEKVMRDTSSGKIVNLLDMRIAKDDPDSFSYSNSKKKLADFTVSAAREYAPHIAVNGVAPGAILPPPARQGQKTREPAGRQLLPHKCTPQDVAAAVVFLLESDGITGQILFVDSGQHLL